MARSRTRRREQDLVVGREIIDDLLLDPPDEPDAVHEALAGIDRHAIAEIVLEVVAADRLDPFDDDLLTEVARAADKRAVVDRLLTVAADKQAPTDRRAAAWSIALKVDMERAQRRVGDVEPDVMMASSQRSLQVVLMRVEMDPETFGAEIRDVLLTVDPEHRRLMWMAYEITRASLGTPAGLVYRDVLDHPALTDLTEQIDGLLDAVPDADAVAAVQRALERASRDEDRARLKRRLMALRTAAAENPLPRPPAKAWATGCDGQGSYLLHAEIERPSGDIIGGQLCLRASGELRSSWVEARVEGVDHERVRAQMALEVGPWAPIEPSAAAALVMQAVERAHRIPAEAVAGVALFRRLYRPGDAPPDPAGPDCAATFSSVSAHLTEPPGRSWYLDSRDLETLGLRLPPPPEASPERIEAWRDEAIRAAVAHDFPARWAEMAEHFGWWLALRGEPDEACRMASAARATRSDPAGSPLVHAIVHHTVEVFGEPEAPLPATPWDDDDDDDDDDMWPDAPAGWRYDGHVGPDPEIWLSLDESVRIEAIAAWHLSPDGPGLVPSEREAFHHAVLQTVVETQLCMDEPPGVREALARLRRDGLDRFQAVLGLNLVLSAHIGRLGPGAQYADDIAAVARGGRDALDDVIHGGPRGRGKAVKRARKPKRPDSGDKKGAHAGARKRRR